jgi:hypothetical protein
MKNLQSLSLPFDNSGRCCSLDLRELVKLDLELGNLHHGGKLPQSLRQLTLYVNDVHRSFLYRRLCWVIRQDQLPTELRSIRLYSINRSDFELNELRATHKDYWPCPMRHTWTYAHSSFLLRTMIRQSSATTGRTRGLHA